MSRKKKKFDPSYFETIENKKLNATIYATMLQSKAYIDLSSNAKVLYTYMKLQYYGQQKKPTEKQDTFVFNKAMYTKEYQLFKNGEQFNKYCHELVKNGFIEVIEYGRNTRTKNIYQFSGKWKEWQVGTDYRPLKMQEHDENLKQKRTKQAKKRNT